MKSRYCASTTKLCITVFTLFVAVHVQSKKPDIAIIGTGYVGLVSGSGLAEFGNTVVCADIDTEKINALKNGIVPIYEPGLAELMSQNVAEQRLSFTSNVRQAVQDAPIIFIAVGTPMDNDGSADLRALFSVVDTIAQGITSYKIIVTKSTVPIGTGKKIRDVLEHDYNIDESLFDIVSNPEFLREGSAINDFLYPDRLVIGADSQQALESVCKIYCRLLDNNVPTVCTNVATSEMIKYASNAFLAAKLSFINEIANVCDATGSNVHVVAHAMGLDHRINPHFFKAGPGYGGSCFPKDTQALLHIAHNHCVELHTIQGAMETNKFQQKIPVQKLLSLTKHALHGKTVAVLGLAFKANTDDIRCSPAITTIEELLAAGAHINAYDPQAMPAMHQFFPHITYCDSAQKALLNADALIIMTEWDEFKNLKPEKLAQLMKGRYIIDARNILNHKALQQYDFIYDGIGQGMHTQEG